MDVVHAKRARRAAREFGDEKGGSAVTVAVPAAGWASSVQEFPSPFPPPAQVPLASRPWRRVR